MIPENKRNNVRMDLYRKYTFESSGDEEIDRVLKIFDSQIKREYAINDGVKEKCISYWNKILFLKSLELTPDDWRLIRNSEYWEEKKKTTGIQSVMHTINKINEI